MEVTNVSQNCKPKVQRLIKNMMPGEVGYTVPWAAIFDSDGNVLSLDDTFGIEKKPGGTVQMKITRYPDRYHIDVHGIKNPVHSGNRVCLT